MVHWQSYYSSEEAKLRGQLGMAPQRPMRHLLFRAKVGIARLLGLKKLHAKMVETPNSVQMYQAD